MTAIWHHDEEGWRLLPPSSFPDEANLHDLVEEAPHLLPLAGSPQLVILGREVRLGTGYADLLAVERSGRPVVIEIKLARNAEARRAVVAQVLAYAAYLYGLSADELERNVLGDHLRKRGYEGIGAAVVADDQSGGVDLSSFEAALGANLRSGRFRLVFVLDDTPEELVRLVGYLEAVTPELVIDLVTVSQYEVGGSVVLVPQRVDPERQVVEAGLAPARQEDHGYEEPGAQGFAVRIRDANPEGREQLQRLHDWAVDLEREGLANLLTYHGQTGNLTLLPRIPVEGVGLVTIWYDATGGYLQLWRSVFERRAPGHIERIEQLAAPSKLGQGTTVRRVTTELLEALTEAYREAGG